MPPPLLSLRQLGGGWSAVSAAGGRGGRARSRGGCGVSRRRPGRGLAAEAARAVGLRARSGAPRWILLPQKWPRTSFSRRRTGRGGKGGRGKRVGKVGFRAGPRGSLAFKGARCPFPTYASARDWSAAAEMGSEGKPGLCEVTSSGK
ncbi:PREDICTED: H/ACA ribonucleoprotein complex subunit 1-like [Hipposideros armiger]|uniref:H/ACA ribonucleoprotein complex subunit 1-like n=1 Tax=Hipposideros armiger TaxID=186990 RepID=A0A8B7QN48_HIPAR|nr:PREDICTED: H/ACA ribonucleoprotein complex subunit 1-like [Hipposideros armiger]